MDRLESMSILLIVAEAGSLSAAATRLSMPLTTVSRRIADLEDHLRTALLTRSSRRIILTDAGRTYLAACKRILEEVGEAERIAAGEYREPKGIIALTGPITFGKTYLLPVLSEFLNEYPNIDAQLILNDRLVSLKEEGVDVALRVGDLPDSALVTTHVGTIQRVFAASPIYLDARGRPESLADLCGHDGIGVEGFTGSAFWSSTDLTRPVIHHRLFVNSTEAAVEAAKAGLGIISVFSHHVFAAFRDGTLEPVLPGVVRPTLSLSLVRASTGALPVKLRAFMDFVTPRLRQRLLVDCQV